MERKEEPSHFILVKSGPYRMTGDKQIKFVGLSQPQAEELAHHLAEISLKWRRKKNLRGRDAMIEAGRNLHGETETVQGDTGTVNSLWKKTGDRFVELTHVEKNSLINAYLKREKTEN